MRVRAATHPVAPIPSSVHDANVAHPDLVEELEFLHPNHPALLRDVLQTSRATAQESDNCCHNRHPAHGTAMDCLTASKSYSSPMLYPPGTNGLALVDSPAAFSGREQSHSHEQYWHEPGRRVVCARACVFGCVSGKMLGARSAGRGSVGGTCVCVIGCHCVRRARTLNVRMVSPIMTVLAK